MKKFLTTLAVFSTLATSVFASNWSAHIRATYLQTVDKSDAFSALGINFAENAISVSDKLIPEIDLNYSFTDSLQAQLVLTIPQEHSVNLAGVGRLGTFKHLPPTLYVQYKAFPGQTFRPYVGAGLNYTLIYGADLVVANVPLSLSTHSIGLAGQLGFDYGFDKDWSLNVDLKKALIRSDVQAGGSTLTEARLDPWLYSIGLRYAF